MQSLAAALTPAQAESFLCDWLLWANHAQLPPAGSWTTWIFLGGRGAGKTRAGAEWMRALALGIAPFANRPHERIALVADNFGSGREVMIEGVSGLMSIHPRDERPQFEKTRGVLTWPNGAMAQLFSAEDPDSLRGPQFHAAWCDEFCTWRHAQAAWDNLQFGLRLGEHPRQLITTTPRPLPLLKKLLAERSTVLTHAATSANAENLSPAFIDQITARYAGTRLGRQELDGEIIEDRADALWTRECIELNRVQQAPQLERIAIAVDPAIGSGKNADACGIVAVGSAGEHVFVLEDGTVERARPDVWAAKAVALYHRLQADALICEVNQGGQMVEAVIATVDAGVPVKSVRATRGKYLRAEPVSALYAKGLVHHVGAFPALEDEMCDFGSDGLSNGRSPNRLDALCWGIFELKLRTAKPLIRRL